MNSFVTSQIRRAFLASSAALACITSSPTIAQEHKVKFQLDWRFEGPSALFLTGMAKGYFQAEKIDMTLDSGNGSATAVNRVASGAYDMGFADLASLMEFHANNPGATNKPVAVMMVYNNTPAAVMALKKSGIKTPADLAGKRLGAPVFDAGRRSFPVFAKANQIDLSRVSWTSMDPPLRETMLARGDIDAITGFYFTSVLNLNARGVKDDDIVVLPFPNFGVKLYGNVIIASEEMVKNKPEVIKAFLRAFTKSARDVINDPDAAIAHVKARDAIIDEALEKRRLRLAINSSIATPDAKAEGFGQARAPRLALMASQISDAFGTRTRINPDIVFNASFLPSKEQLNILPK